MVIFDQLRISDDGKNFFIDAHVNKASYFNNVYIKKITICTEDQVSETNPLDYGDDFIYQKSYVPSTESSILPVYDKVCILSEQQLLNTRNGYGGWLLQYQPVDGATDNALSLVWSGKFTKLTTGFAPKLVVATNAFNPDVDHLNSPEVLFTVNGEEYEERGHRVWQFKGKGDIKSYTTVNCYLYKQTADGTFEFISLDENDDRNFLHFLWQVWYMVSETNKKELHMVLDRNSFIDAFNNLKYNEEGKPYKDESGEWARLHDGPVATVDFRDGLSHNMFFVYIECETDSIDPCTPCRLDEPTTLGVTFDYGIIYSQAMNYTKELADDCSIPNNFLDFILNTEALKLSIETEHYIPAIQYWKNLMNANIRNAHGITKPCGCHG